MWTVEPMTNKTAQFYQLLCLTKKNVQIEKCFKLLSYQSLKYRKLLLKQGVCGNYSTSANTLLKELDYDWKWATCYKHLHQRKLRNFKSIIRIGFKLVFAVGP